MGERRIVRIILLCVVVLAAGSAFAADDDSRARPRVEIAATGGFAGLAQVSVQTVPNLICPENAVNRNPTSSIGTATQLGACTVDPDHVRIIKNTTHNWKPASSAGVIFRWVIHKDNGDATNDGLGAGIGAHFVFIPNSSDTRAAPAVTFHVGKKNLQVFAGWIFAPTDEVTLPNGSTEAVVPASFTTSSLLRADGGREATFFAGIVIGSLSLTKQP